MTDYDRTTVRETATDGAPVVRDTLARDRVVTREASYRAGPSGGEMIRRAVMLIFGILQALLILRIILLLLGANLGNDIVGLIVGITDPFVEPFRTMFSFTRAQAGQQILDIAAVVALIGWTLLEVLIIAVLSLGARRGEDATV
jgi:uncharacterized protein YggT (Ycf19 family)